MTKWKDREHFDKQGKFRVGDLVRLSSYGKSTEQNTNEFFDGTEIGLITEISYCRTYSSDKYPIQVQWVNHNNKNIPKRFFFRELKRVRT